MDFATACVNIEDVPNYSEILIQFQAELQRITELRDEAQEQMDRIIRAIKAIEVLAAESDQPVVPLSPDQEEGFTDQVRTILKVNPLKAFSAVEIRDVILERHPRSNPKVTLIHTHNTLKRLLKQSELTEKTTPDGRTVYTWKNQPTVIDLMAALKKSMADTEKKRIDEETARLAAFEKGWGNLKKKIDEKAAITPEKQEEKEKQKVKT